jgi:hypothetical protein
VDFGSNAIVERFGADIERGRGVRTPAFAFGGGDPVEGYGPYERGRSRRAPSWRETRSRASRRRCGGSARRRRRR